MAEIVDFHVHVFPDLLGRLASQLGQDAGSPVANGLENWRRAVRKWKEPVSRSFHGALTLTRHFPSVLRDTVDQLGALLPVPGLVVESSDRDLDEVLSSSGVTHAVVIAHPPLVSNEFVMQACSARSNWFAAVNIPKDTARPGLRLKEYVAQGARVLKIHPAADGEGPDSPRYRVLLRTAGELQIPVILHTGCIHSHLLYRKPELGGVDHFTSWFKAHPNVQFVLAHMNFHNPNAALDLCERFSNLYVDTSWQPAEVISEAVRRIGAGRVLFGSDWPLLGANIRVGLDRIRNCVAGGFLKEDEANLILGGNALRLLKQEPDATKTD